MGAELWFGSLLRYTTVQWCRRYDSKIFHANQTDADVCIHCTFTDIGVLPGGEFVKRQKQAYLISRDLPWPMLVMG